MGKAMLDKQALLGVCVLLCDPNLKETCKKFYTAVLRQGAAIQYFRLTSGPGHPIENLLEF